MATPRDTILPPIKALFVIMTSQSNDPHVGHSRTQSEGTPAAGGAGTPKLTDWRHIPFLAVDSAHTNLVEDGIAVRQFGRGGNDWSADLKVVHPLPLNGPASLVAGERQVCLGIRDTVVQHGGLRPAVSLVVATNLTRLTDRQANAILNGRERDIRSLRGEHPPTTGRLHALKRGLASLQAAARKISRRGGEEIAAEYTVSIVVNHAQKAAIQASRGLDSCPPLVVLRAEGSRTLPMPNRGGSTPSVSRHYTVAAGKTVPTLLEPGENAQQFDSLRLKERGNSGAINITQLSCALLGIAPLPEALVRLGLREDSELDRWKKGGPLPDALANAIVQKRREIREVLLQLF